MWRSSRERQSRSNFNSMDVSAGSIPGAEVMYVTVLWTDETAPREQAARFGTMGNTVRARHSPGLAMLMAPRCMPMGADRSARLALLPSFMSIMASMQGGDHRRGPHPRTSATARRVPLGFEGRRHRAGTGHCHPLEPNRRQVVSALARHNSWR